MYVCLCFLPKAFIYGRCTNISLTLIVAPATASVHTTDMGIIMADPIGEDSTAPTGGIIDTVRKYESRHSGPDSESSKPESSQAIMACFERHWIPASADMTFVLVC